MVFNTRNGVFTTKNGVFSPAIEPVESFEDIALMSERYDGGGSGSSALRSSSSLAEDSTQGLNIQDFQEWTAPHTAFEQPLQADREATFLFRPNNTGSNIYAFIFTAATSSIESECYRFEFHMSGGVRIVDMEGGRDVIATSGSMSYSSGSTYLVRFIPDQDNGIDLFVGPPGEDPQDHAATSQTKHLGPELSIGWRGSGGGNVDYDHLTQE